MSKDNSSSDQTQSAETARKPYEKPGFRYEQVFVTSALSCGKVQGEGSCSLNTKVS